jgi:hypothetical protein
MPNAQIFLLSFEREFIKKAGGGSETGGLQAGENRGAGFFSGFPAPAGKPEKGLSKY